MQRAKKSQSGTIGQTRQNNYVAEWELVYHKILNISNLFHGTSSSRFVFPRNRSTLSTWRINFNFTKRKHQKSNNFFSRRGNLNLVTLSSIAKFHHFTTGQCVNENDANRILSIVKDVSKQYVKFRDKHFAKKEKKLSDTIKKKQNILLSFELG